MEWTIEVMLVPVADVERAKQFYSEQVGFAVDLDIPLGTDRMVQLTPPGSGCSIHLRTGSGGMTPGSLRGAIIVVPDIDAAHDELAGRGVGVGTVGHFDGDKFVDGKGGRWNSFMNFSDPDGNEWTVQESPADR